MRADCVYIQNLDDRQTIIVNLGGNGAVVVWAAPVFSETRLVVIEMQVSYRLTTPTLGMIESENGDRTLVTIPQRAVITVVDG